VGFVFRYLRHPVAQGLPVQRAITATVMSMPAETPDEVATLPLSTQRALATQRTLGPGAMEDLKAILLVVAALPSKSPAAASRDAPLQTDMTSDVFFCLRPQPGKGCLVLNQRDRANAARHKQIVQRGRIGVVKIRHCPGPLIEGTGPLLAATVTRRMSTRSDFSPKKRVGACLRLPHISMGP